MPFGILAIAIAWTAIPNERGEAPRRFDLPGFLLVGAGLVLLQAVLETAGRGTVPLGIQLGMAAAGVVVLGVYVWCWI